MQLFFLLAEVAKMVPSLQHRLRAILPWAQLFFTSTRNYLSQQPLESKCIHVIFVFIVPLLAQLLEVKYEGKAASPFETHPKTMLFFILCLLAYCVVYGIELRFSSASQSSIYAHAMVLFGSLSLASIASIFFPDSVRWVLYLVYIMLCMGQILYTLVLVLYKWLHQTIGSGTDAALPQGAAGPQTSEDEGNTPSP